VDLVKASFAVLLITCLNGCALSLEGNWRATLPDGQGYVVEVQDRPEKQYYFYHPDLHLSGVYQLQGKKLLVIEKPNNPRANGFEIQILNRGHLRIISEPAARLTGIRYLGMELEKASDSEE
jgi:hypothetical protein